MRGLSSYDVEYRKNNDMINNKNIKNSRSIKSILFSNIITLFNFIHFILFILVLTTGYLNNTMFIYSIIFNMLISIYQELKAKKIIDKLSIANIVKVRVIRDSDEKEIAPNEIVIDDLLYLKQGDSLIVDAVIVKASNLEVDESIITGESNAILKNDGDFLVSGSVITCGTAYAKVVSVNRDTYANNLINEASKVVDDSSYLMRNINLILGVVTFLIIPVGSLLFITQFFFSNQSYSDSILSSVAGIVGMIPDGLVLLTSISLTVGVIKMASKKVIVQKLSGIELLACVDVLCLDKTGTITDGSMKVVDVIDVVKDVKLDAIISNMASDKFNATDVALSNYFKFIEKLDIIEILPFSSSRKYSLVKFDFGIYALGALECISNKQIEDFIELSDYINLGYRIITLVRCNKKFDKKTNKVVAFIVLKDNIRKNAKKTLEYFEQQKVEIKIISGDNPKVVSNILKQLDFSDYNKYISGNDLPDNYEELKKIVNNYKIFGRVTPHQKQSIIRALKENSKVGMIGDGVNDILALKEADCGIALASGISAARSVSEIVLTESDFGVLPCIVNEGRRVVNNIERVASMYLIKTVYSFLISLLCIFFSHEYPFYPVQLSLIGVVCVGIPSFFIALDPNYCKVKKGFLVKVFRSALPSGLCVSINILILILMSYIFKFDFEYFRLTVVATTGYLNLRLLYNVSKPFTILKKILISFCSFSFLFLLLIFADFFVIRVYNILTFILIFILIFINNYLVLFFQEIYDKIVLRYDNKKREKD